MSVTAVYDLYKRKKSKDLADGSFTLKDKAVSLFCEFAGDIPAVDVTEDMAEDFRLWLHNEERGKVSANIYLSNIKPLFAWLAAGRQPYIPFNPFADIRRYRTERMVRPIFEPEEINRLLKMADARWKVIVLLGAEHSLRRGEVLNLCRDDIEGRWLHVRAKKKTATTWPWTIKNHAQTLLPISPRLAQALPDLQRIVPVAQPYLIVPPDRYRRMLHLQAENSLTPDDRGKPYSNFNRAWRQLQRRASVPLRPYKDLRTTFACALRLGGMGADDVSEQMRHSSLAVTQAYLRHGAYTELAGKTLDALQLFYGVVPP